MDSHQILTMLLDKLKERTSYCPYCSGEVAHIEQCPLEGLWFKDDKQQDIDDMDDMSYITQIWNNEGAQ